MSKIDKIERVAAYIRVSTQEQKLHGLSLDAQVQKIEDYAKEHKMKIVEWYKDEGVSGRKLIKRRPELQRMIKDAEKGQFERILFIKLDRFFRSVAEYHECMKQIAPVVWTTTEEDYDLSTANGRMLVNMKLTIAEMEADQTGERIKIVNEYKASTGQPLVGKQSLCLGFMVGTKDGKKAVVKDPDEEQAVEEAIQHYLTYQSRRKTMVFLQAKHHIHLSYNSIAKLFENTMLYGFYRGNPDYCEPYIDKETFCKMQKISESNIKVNTRQNRTYLFSGLLRCPECGRSLTGASVTNTKKSGKRYTYKRYRCPANRLDICCSNKSTVGENALEKKMLVNIEKHLAEAKIRSLEVNESKEDAIPKYNIEEIHAEIDRLNYSWRKGKIRTVEQYEKEYEELMEQLNEAEANHETTVTKDFSKIEEILKSGWRGIYTALDEEHKQAFWRSFVRSIELDWTSANKEITRVNFF